MTRILIGFLILISLPGNAFEQRDSINRNSVFVELGGMGIYYSINYDRKIKFTENFGIAPGLGLSVIPRSGILTALPVQVKTFYQIKKHTFECGFGITFFGYYDKDRTFSQNLEETATAWFGQIGYRYSLCKDRIFIGGGFTPLLYTLGNSYFYPWGTIKVGYRF